MNEQEITFYNRTYIVIDYNRATKSKKTSRPKYQKCMLCSETRYITRHHIIGHITIPLCPTHHHAVHMGDIDIHLKRRKG